MSNNRIQHSAPEEEWPVRKVLMALFNRYMAREAFYEERFVSDDVARIICQNGWAQRVNGGWKITDEGIVQWARMTHETLRGQPSLHARLIRDIAETGNAHSNILPRCQVCGEVCLSYIKGNGTRAYYKRCALHQHKLIRSRGKRSDLMEDEE